MNDIWVFDLDDTLADTRHRAHLKPVNSTGHGEEWVPYSMACAGDGVHRAPGTLFKMARNWAEPWIVTGRTERARNLTEIWLDLMGLYQEDMLMRGDGYHRPNVELKLEALDYLEGMGRNVTLWVDDYTKVIEAISARGIPTFHFRAADGSGMSDDPARREQ